MVQFCQRRRRWQSTPTALTAFKWSFFTMVGGLRTQNKKSVHVSFLRKVSQELPRCMAYYYIIRGYYYIYYYIIICTFLHQWKAGAAQNACSACYNIASRSLSVLSRSEPGATERAREALLQQVGAFAYIGLTGDIFRRRLSSAEIIFGGDNFRHHFRQISALISAEMFSNIKFSTVAIMDVPSPILGSVLLVARARFDIWKMFRPLG